MKKIKLLKAIVILVLISCFYSQGFSQIPVVTTPEVSTTDGKFKLMKGVTQSPTVQSGVPFFYTLIFTVPDGAKEVKIIDQLPTGLHLYAAPTISACGMTVTTSGAVLNTSAAMTFTIKPPITNCVGTISIPVIFPAGVTCNNTLVSNSAQLVGIDPGGVTVNLGTTTLAITATAVSPWQVEEFSTPVPLNLTCGQTATQTKFHHRVRLNKNWSYWNNVAGQLNMTMPVIRSIITNANTSGTIVSNAMVTFLSGNTSGPSLPILPPLVTNSGSNLEVKVPLTTTLDITDTYWNTGWVLEYDIEYPATSSIHDFTTQLLGTSCNTSITSNIQTPRDKVEQVVASPISKTVSGKDAYNRIFPGCKGTYTITICNPINVPLTSTNCSVTDALPAGLMYGSPIVTGGLSATISGNNLSLVFPGGNNIPVGGSVTISLDFTVSNTATPNTTITNTANVSINNVTTNASASFIVGVPTPVFCLKKSICSPTSGAPPSTYLPGEILTFRLMVMNRGTADGTNIVFTDTLAPWLKYVGSEKYKIATPLLPNQYSPDISCISTSNITPWTGVTTSHSGQVLKWGGTGLNIPTTTPCGYVLGCGSTNQQGNTPLAKYYIIEFDVMVSDTAPKGNIPNRFWLKGDNFSPDSSNIQLVHVDGTLSFNPVKSIISPTSGIVTPSAVIEYELKANKTGPLALYRAIMVDELPKNASTDRFLFSGANRGSAFDINYNSLTFPISPSPVPSIVTTGATDVKINSLTSSATSPPFGGMTNNYFSTSGGSNAWTLTAGTKNFYFGFDVISITNTNGIVRFKASVSPTALANQESCNSFAMNGAMRQLTNSTLIQDILLTSIESPKVCVKVQDVIKDSICCPLKTKLASSELCCSRVQFSPKPNCKTPIASISVANIVGGTITSLNAIGAPCAATGTPLTINYGFNTPCNLTTNQTLAICGTGNAATGMVIYDIILTLADKSECRYRDTILCKTPPLDTCCPKKITKIVPQGTNCCSQVLIERDSNCVTPIRSISIGNVLGGNVTSLVSSTPCPGTGSGSPLTINYLTPCTLASNQILTICGTGNSSSSSVSYDILITLANGKICSYRDSFRCIQPKPDTCCPKKVTKLEGKVCCSLLQIQGDSNCVTPIRTINVTNISGGFITNVSTPSPCVGNATGNATGTGSVGFSYASPCNLSSNLNVNICGTSNTPSGVVFFDVQIVLANGTICTYRDSLKCTPKPTDLCCPKMRVIKQVTACGFTNYTFDFTALGQPICNISINSTLSFLQNSLFTDGTSQGTTFWSNTRIPQMGSLNPSVQNLVFTISTTTGSTGTISFDVELCDGTHCTDYVYTASNDSHNASIGTTVKPITQSLFASSFNLKPSSTGAENVKVAYIICAPDSCEQSNSNSNLFFAISGGYNFGDANTTMIPFAATMQGRNNALFEFLTPQPIRSIDDKLSFNIVTTRRVPRLKLSYYDAKGVLISNSVVSNFQQPISTSTTELRQQVNLSVSPNPVSDRLRINYTIGQAQNITLDLIDVLGHRIATMDSGKKSENATYEVDYDTTNLSEGIYFIRLTNELGQVSTQKVTVVR
jgi:uncharacterized repeat protein (TIGR01451 family)